MENSNSFLVKEMANKRLTFLTVIVLFIFLSIFFLAYHVFGNDTPNARLRTLHIVFRHGAKAPSFTYPTDPYAQHDWLVGKGDLTNEGKAQLYEVGIKLRRIYGSFVGDQYNASEVSILSSYAPRSQMSCLTLLAGLFPPKGSQVWNKELAWQPIPINVLPREKDNLIASRMPCKAFDEEKSNIDTEFKANLKAEDKETMHYLSTHTKMSIENISQTEAGLKLPEWTKKVYPDKMAKMSYLTIAAYTGNSKLKRLQAGPMLKRWLENINNGEPKLNLYSGHDVTIINLLRALGFEDLIFPDYGSCLIVEHYEANQSFIKLLYFKSSSQMEPEVLKIPFCDQNCDIFRFSQLTEPYVPDNWKNECNLIVE